MIGKTNTVGIKEQILQATSESQIANLLAEVNGYHYVSQRTINRCTRAAVKRATQLVTVKKEAA